MTRKADIAVLQLDRDDLPAARLGNSDEAQVGTWVMALGSPFGLMHSVSQGIISARGRQMDELPDVVNQDFLQTDAAINPGNSGGPLVNMKGEVIGINNSIASNGGGNEGVGFSIPINLARWIMNELIAHGRVTRGALGVDLQPQFLAEGRRRPGHGHGQEGRGSARFTARRRPRSGGHSRWRCRSAILRDRNHRSEPSDQHGFDVRGGRARRGDHLARPPRAQTDGDRRRPRANAQPVDRPPDGRRRDPSGLLRRPNRPGAGSSYVLGLELATLNPELAKRIEFPESWRGALVLSVDSQSPLARLVQAE